MIKQELLNYRNENAEKMLLGYICEKRQFVDVSEDYIFTTKILHMYLGLKGQYNRTGKVEPSLLGDDYINFTLEVIDMYIPVAPEPIIEELAEAYQIRETYRALTASIQALNANNAQINTNIVDTQKKLSDIMIKDKRAQYNHEYSVYKFLEYVNDGVNSDNSIRGMQSNMTKLDEMISGWQKQKTYVIAGMEKLGKSRFCLSLANVWLQKKHGGIIFSMEMTKNDIHECMLSDRFRFETGKAGTNGIDKALARKIFEGTKKTYMKEPLIIDTSSSITTSHIRTMIRKHKASMSQKGISLDWIVVDYIQRMVGVEDRANHLECVSQQIADIARDEDVCMLVVSQLNKGAETATSDQKPYQFIKGSKGIREAADCMIVLYEPSKNFEGDKMVSIDMKAYVVQRKGISNVYANVEAQLQYSRFGDKVGQNEPMHSGEPF